MYISNVASIMRIKDLSFSLFLAFSDESEGSCKRDGGY